MVKLPLTTILGVPAVVSFIALTLVEIAVMSDASPRRLPPKPNAAGVCRDADGRIRLGCLPPGTVRALSVPAPEQKSVAPVTNSKKRVPHS